MNGFHQLTRYTIHVLVAIGFVAVGCALPAGAQQNPYTLGGSSVEVSPSVAIIETARRSVAEGKLDEAIHSLSLYVIAHPNDVEPAKYLGDLYYRQADLKKAEAMYRHVLDVMPKDRQTHDRLGGIYAAEDRVSEAIIEFTESLPANSTAYNQLVELHRRRGDLSEFVSSSRHQADELPLDFVAQYNMGRIYNAQHDYRLAAYYLERALNNEPTDCATMSVLGSVYLDLGNSTSAFGMLNRCLKASPDDYAALVNRADAYIQLARDDLAKADLNHALRVRPDGSEAVLDLGYIDDDAGRWRSAVSYYLKAMSIDPLMREAYVDLGYDYGEHQLYALAEASYLKGLSIAPADGRLHYLLGVTYQDQGKRDLAQGEFKRAAASDEDEVARAANRILANSARTTQ